MYMSRIRIVFERLVKCSKFPNGPITVHKPIPMFPTALTAPEIPTIESCSAIATMNADAATIAK